MKTKVCSKCGIEKDVVEFSKDKSRQDKLCCQCKECMKKSWKKWAKNNKEKIKETTKRWVKKRPHRNWTNTTLGGHKQSGYKINITKDELEKMAKKTKYCPICDVKLDWTYYTKGKKQINSPSLDRINNEKFLNKNNVQIVCLRCNRAKGEMSMNEFYKYCQIIIKRKKEVK